MNNILLHTYAVKHKSEEVRSNSRSGGIFTALSDQVLKNNGCVYGCILNEKFEALHVKATTEEERNKMRGSKYIQSNMGDVFEKVKEDLITGRQVLYSGTSCQVAGLKAYLGQEYSNLICVDIVCHGVPSGLVWKKFLKWQEEKNNSKCVGVDFRNKKDFGWAAHVESLTMDNGQKVDSEVFKILFYEHSILRPSCYKCPYKDIVHPSDITIADYWGIDKAAPEFNDDKGVSLVLINSEAGQKLFESVKDCIVYKETKIEDSMQPPLESPFKSPIDRALVWKDLREKPFEYIVKRYATPSFASRLMRKVRKGFIKLFSL